MFRHLVLLVVGQLLVHDPLLLYAEFMRRYVSTELTSIPSEYTLEAPQCTCTGQCFVQTTCTAVTVTPVAGGNPQCTFYSTRKRQEALQASSVLGIITFMKAPACPVLFEEFSLDFGCVFVSTKTVDFDTASTSCPGNTALVVPTSVELYWKLVEFLRDHGYTNGPNYWIDLKRSSIADTFKWPDGTEITGDIWYAGEPSGEPCARIATNLGYKLCDKECTVAYGFVCI